MLNYGMVGGGRGAFIGAVHRIAAAMDGSGRLVAGALSVDPAEALASGRELGLDADRNYSNWRELVEREKGRVAGERLDWVSIVTPNHAHFEIAMGLVEAGFNVVCEKPLVTSAAEARALAKAVEKAGVVFCVTYNYTGYPMVKQAAEMVRAGEIGAVRKVVVEYHQGWLATKLESEQGAGGHAQAAWRTDPKKAGIGGAIGDIGTHAENLVSTITGLEIESVCAELTSFVPGRALDDDAAMLLRFKQRGGVQARGTLSASQVCVGEENNLSIRVYGERGGLAWRQESPNELRVSRLGEATRVMTRGGAGAGAGAAAARATRIPGGHPEGYLEAFANLYRGVAEAVLAKREGRKATGLGAECPGVWDGVRGVEFVESVVRSSKGGGVWVACGGVSR